MNNIKPQSLLSNYYNHIFKDLVSGWKYYELIFLLVMIALQVFIFYYNPDSMVAMVAGIAGIINVVFIAKGKISNYIFGLIFAYTYFYSSLDNKFYGEVTTTIFVYIPAQFVGYFMWLSNMQKTTNSDAVIAKKMTTKEIFITFIVITIATVLFVSYLRTTDGNSVFLDGLTTVMVVVAQVLMLLRYREQWALWTIINILSIILWSDTPNLMLMNIGFLINGLYGYYNWSKLAIVK